MSAPRRPFRTVNLSVALEQLWVSTRLTRWFMGCYCAWILLGSVWGWYQYCDVNGSVFARVTLVHTTLNKVDAFGRVAIHEYTGDARRVRFVGDARLEVVSGSASVLGLSLQFRNVCHDDQMTVRCRPSNVESSVGSLFGHSVKVSIPVPPGEQEVELSFGQNDVQYVISAVDLALSPSESGAIVAKRAWRPFLERGGVRFAMGSGWTPVLPNLGVVDPFNHTGRHAYLLLTVDEPGDYDLVLPWVPTDPSYGRPTILLDGHECSMNLVEAKPGLERVWRSLIRLRLQDKHVLCVRLNEKIVSPFSQWASRDRRFLGLQIPWNWMEVRRRP